MGAVFVSCFEKKKNLFRKSNAFFFFFLEATTCFFYFAGKAGFIKNIYFFKQNTDPK